MYEFVSGSDAKVDKFFQDKFNNSDKIPTTGTYAGNENARVIDEYNLLTNNCTTISIEAIQAGGGDTSFSVLIFRHWEHLNILQKQSYLIKSNLGLVLIEKS